MGKRELCKVQVKFDRFLLQEICWVRVKFHRHRRKCSPQAATKLHLCYHQRACKIYFMYLKLCWIIWILKSTRFLSKFFFYFVTIFPRLFSKMFSFQDIEVFQFKYFILYIISNINVVKKSVSIIILIKVCITHRRITFGFWFIRNLFCKYFYFLPMHITSNTSQSELTQSFSMQINLNILMKYSGCFLIL